MEETQPAVNRVRASSLDKMWFSMISWWIAVVSGVAPSSSTEVLVVMAEEDITRILHKGVLV